MSALVNLAKRGAYFLSCQWCKKFKTITGEWVDLKEAAPRGNISHGWCDGPCLREYCGQNNIDYEKIKSKGGSK